MSPQHRDHLKETHPVIVGVLDASQNHDDAEGQPGGDGGDGADLGDELEDDDAEEVDFGQTLELLVQVERNEG